jgi:hypothetical protein
MFSSILWLLDWVSKIDGGIKVYRFLERSSDKVWFNRCGVALLVLCCVCSFLMPLTLMEPLILHGANQPLLAISIIILLPIHLMACLGGLNQSFNWLENAKLKSAV